MTHDDWTPEECMIEYERRVSTAQYRLTYKLCDSSMTALAFDGAHLVQVLDDLRKMGVVLIGIDELGGA